MVEVEFVPFALITFIISLIIIGLVLWFMIFRYKPKHYFLILFRVAVFIIATVLLLQPTYTLYDTPSKKQELPVFIDSTKSMVFGEPMTRWDECKNWLLNNPELAKLNQKYSIKYYSFYNSTVTVYNNNSAPKGSYTDLSVPINYINSGFNNQIPPGIILVTDGIHNSPSNDILSTAKTVNYPINCIEAETRIKHDLVIDKVEYSNIAFKNIPTKIDTEITGSGYENSELNVMLTEGNNVLQNQKTMVKA